MNNSSIPATLQEILAHGDVDDLDVLVDYITDSGKGRLALDKSLCAKLVDAKAMHAYPSEERQLIEFEIRKFGGNSVANLVRDLRGLLQSSNSKVSAKAADLVMGVSYDEIVRDVAKHLKVDVSRFAGTPEVEEDLLKSLLLSSFEKMTPQERETVLNELEIPGAADLAHRSVAAIGVGIVAASFTTAMSFYLARYIAGGAVYALLGRGLAVGALALVSRPVAVLAGPVGWALTGAWALADMASPAYRVTIPCVVQVAYMRKKAEMVAHAPR